MKSTPDMIPGTRVAWRRGPSGGLVIGTVISESERSPERWWSRADERRDHDAAPLRRLWDCREERFSDDWPSSPGTIWTVPDCDFVEVPE